jgi:hypothetical protein
MTGDLNLVSSGGSNLPSVRPQEALEIAVDSALMTGSNCDTARVTIGRI